MTELERLAAALLAQWRAEGGEGGGPIPVSALLDRVLPYRVARRILGIDISEDYEALVLRLLSEEEGLVRVEPYDAAELARTTITSRLPDLDVLQLLRSATVTLADRAIARLQDVLPMPNTKEESKREGSPPPDAESAVIPLHGTPEPEFEPAAAEPPPAFLTTVSFSPPEDNRCWSCAESLPTDRPAKFCPFCGADQRQPVCPGCGAAAERRWKHCPDCGTRLWPV